MSIAIDFGTSNTVIARWNSVTEEAEILNLSGMSQKLNLSPPLIPSLVYVENAQQGKILLGAEVREQGLDLNNDPRFFSNFKRGIGGSLGFFPELDQRTVTFEQVGEWFLQALLAQVETPESLVLTVPVDSFEVYRNWLTGACEGWQTKKVRIIDEPTAAALGYGTAEGDILLVVDFGGGTLDLSLVQLNTGITKEPQGFILKWGTKLLGKSETQNQRTARVLGKVGENLGGSDIDNWLVNYFAQTQKLPKSSLTTRLAERLKINLSTATEAQEVYCDDPTGKTYELALDRQTFQNILTENKFFERLDQLMTSVLQQGRRRGIEVEDIDAVLLVGGGVQMPAFKSWVEGYFDPAKIKSHLPMTAIASGALQLAQGYQLQDFLYHSYGIRYWNQQEQCHSWHPLIRRGQPYPMKEPVELVLGASVENQSQIELIIGELGSDIGSTEVYFSGDRLLTRTIESEQTVVKPLNDKNGGQNIAQLNPPGQPGKDRIKVQFRVDEDGFLRMTVEDLLLFSTLLDDCKVAQLS